MLIVECPVAVQLRASHGRAVETATEERAGAFRRFKVSVDSLAEQIMQLSLASDSLIRPTSSNRGSQYRATRTDRPSQCIRWPPSSLDMPSNALVGPGSMWK